MREYVNSENVGQVEELLLMTEQMQDELDQKDETIMELNRQLSRSLRLNEKLNSENRAENIEALRTRLRQTEQRYAFYYNETGTHQILDDVKNRVCDLGILYLSHENEVVMRKVIEENHLVFTELFSAKPHVFLQKDHPLASKKVVSVHDLAPYPRLNFVQGEYESVYFSEELFSSIPVDKEIRVNDRGAIVNFMLGLNAYTISSGIFPK